MFHQAERDLGNLADDSRFTANASDLIESFQRDAFERKIILRYFKQGATSAERIAETEADAPTVYGRRHVRLHEATRRMLEQRGYADALIIDTSGQIVYTATKSADFGANVEDAVFAPTALPLMMEILRASSDRSVSSIDFKPYIVDEGSLSGFIGIPILRLASVAMGTNQPTVRIGYLIFRLTPDVVARVSSDPVGLGTTGRILVLGPEGGSRIGNAASPLLNTASEASTIASSVAIEAMGTKWTVRVEQETSEALSGLHALLVRLVLGSIVVTILAVAIATYSAQTLVRPLVDLTRTLQRFARHEWTGEIAGDGRADEIGAIARAVVQIRDMAVRQANALTDVYRTISEENERLANIDALTDLCNRRGFYSGVQERLAGMARGTSCTILMMDLDGFKQVNDTYGHAAGDELLGQVASRLRKTLGEDALVARFGGDEFAAFLIGAEADKAATLATDIIADMSVRFELDRQAAARVGVSVGICAFYPSTTEIEQAIRNADEALYAAKAAGKSTYQIHGDTRQEGRQRRQLIEAELREAVMNGKGFCLHYQPIVDAKTLQIVAREALLRWISPSFGNISPSEFIPVAEETKLIRKIGHWVLTT